MTCAAKRCIACPCLIRTAQHFWLIRCPARQVAQTSSCLAAATPAGHPTVGAGDHGARHDACRAVAVPAIAGNRTAGHDLLSAQTSLT